MSWKKIALKRSIKMLLKSKSVVILSFFLLYTAQKTLASFLRVEPQAFLIKINWSNTTDFKVLHRVTSCESTTHSLESMLSIHQHSPVIKDNEQEKLNISCRQFVVILTIGQNRFETNRYVIRPLIGQKLSFILQWNS